MANQAAKKLVQQNTRIMRNVFALVLVSHAALVVLGVAVPRLRSVPGAFASGAPSIAAHTANSGAMLGAVWLLWTISRPTRNAEGELVDGGADLSMAGALHQYYFDIVYVTAFVQVAVVAVSSWFWLVHLLTVGFATVKLWTGVLQPLFFGGTAEDSQQQQQQQRLGSRRQRREKEAQEKHRSRTTRQ